MAQSVSCITVPSTNLLLNPSWELGTANWSYSNAFITTSNADATNGDYCLVIPRTVNSAIAYQAVADLEIGTEDTLSVDWKLYPPTLTENCYLYLYHDALLTTNIVASESPMASPSTVAWRTLKGTYTATSSSMVFGIYTYCSPSSIAQQAICFDNAQLLGPDTEVCTTGILSTAVSSVPVLPSPTSTESLAPPIAVDSPSPMATSTLLALSSPASSYIPASPSFRTGAGSGSRASHAVSSFTRITTLQSSSRPYLSSPFGTLGSPGNDSKPTPWRGAISSSAFNGSTNNTRDRFGLRSPSSVTSVPVPLYTGAASLSHATWAPVLTWVATLGMVIQLL
ncbi:hypothetical protein BO78DRAFT_160515 [Aspergillus sclerotiicarbonarius CBS 121057]|uniref:CBM-cenC domain-containing protein n=1 Tax=Aspergillus sclerotiicarbonarius (strain CBS 121057 / IBT 28362) TaxID=1448318 RepID=A0A319F5D5_ASPSB|nr:hypothetical protein BO78DRAFT_160515 [Aspergillus sclerotiicarbonarius CBS 121057]